MSLTSPLALDVFADRIGILTAPFKLETSQELSGLGTGQILKADLAPARWTVDVTTRELRTSVAVQMEALLQWLENNQGSFYLYDPRKCGPYADPTGTTLGSSTVQVNSIPDASSLTLKGLPDSYVLTAGDMLAIDYGSPSRRALFRMAEGVTANGSGVTGAFTVAPFVPSAVAEDDAVTLIKPSAKMMVVPGSVDPSYRGSLTTITFQATQKP